LGSQNAREYLVNTHGSKSWPEDDSVESKHVAINKTCNLLLLC